jgi:hypothetical protein
MYDLEVTAHSAANAEDVWAVLVDSLRWPDWTGLPTPAMTRQGDPAPFGLGAVRCFRFGPLVAEEEVMLWEPPHRYGYAVHRMPVRSYRAEVILGPDSIGGTVITWRARFERCTVPAMSRPFRWFVKTALGRFAKQLARHAESGATVHSERKNHD